MSFMFTVFFVRPLVINWTLLTTLNYNLESRFVSERDGGDHKRSSPSRLLTSVKILTSLFLCVLILYFVNQGARCLFL